MTYGKSSAAPEPAVRTVTEYVDRYIEIPSVEVVETVVEKKIIKEVPFIEYIEIEKEVPVELKPFESEAELAAWLDTDRTNELPYIKDLFECENFALTLINHALKDGHHLSFQVLKNYTRPDTSEFTKGPHAVNSAIIGNDIYFIDPQTDEFWVAYILERENSGEYP